MDSTLIKPIRVGTKCDSDVDFRPVPIWNYEKTSKPRPSGHWWNRKWFCPSCSSLLRIARGAPGTYDDFYCDNCDYIHWAKLGCDMGGYSYYRMR